MVDDSIRVMKKCPNCNWRLFDKITPASGRIEIKCPKCCAVVVIDLSYRRTASNYPNYRVQPTSYAF